MSTLSTAVSRRTLLGVVAAGAATTGVASRATAGPTTVAPALVSDATTATLAEFEAKALALEPPMFLLETKVPDQFSALDGSAATILDRIAHFGEHSLKWDYQAGLRLQVRAPIEFSSDWTPSRSGSTRPSPRRESCGWSSGAARAPTLGASETELHRLANAWIKCAYDLQGKTGKGMNTMRFVAPASAGTLHLDQLILDTPLRSDYPTPDRQVPFVNPDVSHEPNKHWRDLLRFSVLAAAPLATPMPTSGCWTHRTSVTSCHRVSVWWSRAACRPGPSKVVPRAGRSHTRPRGWSKGRYPAGVTYECAMVVGATSAGMTTFAFDMTNSQTAPYRVLRHDTSAHVVWDRATQVTGDAMFEETKSLTDGMVRSVNAACVVLTRPDAEQLHL